MTATTTAPAIITAGVGPRARLFATWAAGYTVAGLLGGLAYRELTRDGTFDGFTQLSVVHTHLLILGTVMSLIFLVIEAIFSISREKFFATFFWLYQAGVVLTSAMMAVIGYQQLNGADHSKALAGISGMGHILITAAFVFFFIALFRALKPASRVATSDAAS